MPKTTPKADIDFEKDLWKAADELRGAVAGNQYKDYVLSLIYPFWMIAFSLPLKNPKKGSTLKLN